MNKLEDVLIEVIMTPLPLETADITTSTENIANQMRDKNKGSIVIIDKKDNDKPIGIITEKDITRRIVAEGKDPKTTPANEIMSKPLITLQPETYIRTAAELMAKYKIRRLPIVKDNQLLGIVTASDYARYLSGKDKNDIILLAMSRYRFLEK